jgi:para-nitrobenzyl esterase
VRAGVLSFRGIPYAAAPVADLRFAAPAPPAHWDGERPATEYGPTIAQPRYPAAVAALLPEPVIAGAECLNLNVWTPDVAGRRPVLVWIHGGAFAHGSGAVPHYDGSAFARDGIVCVTLNYRLGVDGFAQVEGAPANRGLLDQLAALRWVRDNIAAFGGDPTRVTIAGESAGAMSVTALLTMPSARGLFRGAIAQSGAGHHALPQATAARVTAALAATLGVPATVAGLSSVPVPTLLTAQSRLAAGKPADRDGLGLMAYQPVIDGRLLPALPIESAIAGAGSDVALLTGTNTDEHALFLVPSGAADRTDEHHALDTLARLGADPAATLAGYRTLLPGADPGQLLVAVLTDWFFRIPAIRLVQARLARGADSHVYRFGWPSPALGGRLGACHALEIPFVFDTLHAPSARPLVGTTPPRPLAEQMHRAWVGFVRDGDPGWPSYGTEQVVHRFGPPTERAAARLRLWNGLR